MAVLAVLLLQVALAGCGLFAPRGAPATRSAATGPGPATASAAPATVAGATYGPGETIGALSVAHVITPAVAALGIAAAPLRLAGVQFVTARIGWAVGSRCAAAGQTCQGVVLATGDGGATWSQRVIAGAPLNGLQFLDTQNGWAFGPTALYATTDGGVTWARVRLPAGLQGVASLSASFVTPTDGWLTVHFQDCGGQGCGVRIYATADGGATWRRIAANAASGGPVPGGLAWAEYIAGGDLGGGHGWMLAQTPAAVMQATADGGHTWSRLVLSSGGAPVGGGFASNGTGWVAATAATGTPAAQVWSSSDDGINWRRVISLPGRVAALAASADGASAWVTLATGACAGAACPEVVSVVSALGTATPAAAVPPGYALDGISALDSTSAWAIGAGAGGYAILATTDGGKTWRPVYQTTAAAVVPGGQLWGFENGADGWAVGSTTDPAALLRTVDGGASWSVAGRVPVGDATSAGFVDPSHGWVAGPAGADVTADGGASWTALALPKGTTVGAMGFATQQNGWLMPASTKAQPSPRLLITADGGRTWTRTSAGPFTSVAFATARLGWAIGGGAGGHVHLLATTDGGYAWQAVADLGPQQWNPAQAAPLWVGARLAGASPDDVWVASGDHLLQSIDGGHTWVDLRGPAASGLVAAPGGYLWVRSGNALYSVTAGGRSWRQVGWAGGL